MIKCNEEYFNKNFTDLDCKNIEVDNSIFENCNFTNCTFDDSLFKKCRFVECTFKSCSINLVKLTGSSFFETEFFNCKMKGINWTELKFSLITVTSPIFFNHCDISYSSFYELQLPTITMTECKAHDVDLRSATLINSDLSGCDFQNSQFNKTNLKSADLRRCINYQIDPTENYIKDAQFSFPDVINLLAPFKIKIDDSDEVR